MTEIGIKRREEDMTDVGTKELVDDLHEIVKLNMSRLNEIRKTFKRLFQIASTLQTRYLTV